eukprot:TRINITY_DN3044_c0_g2_i3.p1 TRINITY_DN3044_c0_g2~~TRINITY_DN3044_c0_g2_i3.p1  ORF type:complete len:145 (-),score=22.10 TRINITY_DN3044_c0_g2_i3:104-538(-)
MIGCQLVYDPRLATRSEKKRQRKLRIKDTSVELYSSFCEIVGSVAEECTRPATCLKKGKNNLAILTEFGQSIYGCSRISTRPYTTKQLNHRSSTQKFTASFDGSSAEKEWSVSKGGRRYKDSDVSRRLLFSKIDDYIKRAQETY